MSEHSWAAENMAAYGAGGLNADERERLARHAAACGGCARALADMRGMDQTLEDLFADVLPAPGLESRIIENLRLAPAPRPWRFGFYAKAAAGIAALVALGVLGALMQGFAHEGGLLFPGQATPKDKNNDLNVQFVGGTPYHPGAELVGGTILVDASES